MASLEDMLRDEVGSYEPTSWEGTLGGHDLVLTATPITAQDMTFINKRHRGFAAEPTLEGMVDMLVRKASSDNGERLTLKHKPMLMKVGIGKIGEIFGGLFGQDLTFDEDDEERAKN